MDEFGESHRIYVWLASHKDGDPFPEDFYDRLNKALAVAGIEWESV
jgi:hypothetical protein